MSSILWFPSFSNTRLILKLKLSIYICFSWFQVFQTVCLFPFIMPFQALLSSHCQMSTSASFESIKPDALVLFYWTLVHDPISYQTTLPFDLKEDPVGPPLQSSHTLPHVPVVNNCRTRCPRFALDATSSAFDALTAHRWMRQTPAGCKIRSR